MEDFTCEQCRAIFVTRLKECPYCGGRVIPKQFSKLYNM